MIKDILIIMGPIITGILTYLFTRKKTDADAAERITIAAGNTVQLMLDEQKRMTGRIEELESLIEGLKDTLKKIGELVLTHPGESIPKAEIARILKT